RPDPALHRAAQPGGDRRLLVPPRARRSARGHRRAVDPALARARDGRARARPCGVLPLALRAAGPDGRPARPERRRAASPRRVAPADPGAAGRRVVMSGRAREARRWARIERWFLGPAPLDGLAAARIAFGATLFFCYAARAPVVMDY